MFCGNTEELSVTDGSDLSLEKRKKGKGYLRRMGNLEPKETILGELLKQVFLPMVIYYVISNAFVILGLSIMQLLKTNAVMESFSEAFLENFILYMETFIKMAGMALGGAAVFPYFKRENSYKEQKSLSRKIIVCMIAAGAVLSLGINYLFSVTGFTQSSEQYSRVAEAQFALPLWLALIFYGILSPVVEEVVFRGIICNALERNTTKVMGMVGSALLFGAFHGNIVQMVYASLMGGIMAYIYQRYQNLLAPVLFHGAANIAIYMVTYF